MNLHFKIEGNLHSSGRGIRIYNGKSDIFFNDYRIINFDSLPDGSKCNIYIKSDKRMIIGGYEVNQVINCSINWNNNLRIYVELIK